MKKNIFLLTVFITAMLFPSVGMLADGNPPKKVLILVEGSSELRNRAMGDGRQLAALLGHFNTVARVQGIDEYVPRSMNRYDYVFYIGFHASNRVPAHFLNDLLKSTQPVVWLNTGFREFTLAPEVRKRYGFYVSRFDSVSTFDAVKARNQVFTKGEPNLNIVEIADKDLTTLLATAVSSKTKKEMPYIVRSGNLLYIADSPFASASETDRYLLFADMLHDILREDHEESHSALIRIEDVTPMENPDRLRDIADFLSSRGIPFLVSVVPFYVNPGEGVRVSMSDKPEVVDALKYMMHNGGTLVMHGVTHQYKGITASDFEFWDESTNKPVRDETVEGISRKLDTGIQEFMKNGLYPLVWETPHYTASFQLYRTVGTYFSTAVEQRLAIEDFDYSQFFPYIITKDLFGQRIYPENLGYVPLDPDRQKSEGYVQNIIRGARANLAVRDGFASCFFHAFVELDLLRTLVDGVQQLGYTYIDLRDHANWVKTKERVILSGNQEYSVSLNGQYLVESYFERDADLMTRTVSDARITGTVSRKITLEPGQFYKAEPAEYREHQPTFVEKVVDNVGRVYNNVFSVEETWNEARTAILWNHHARGAAYNDQASLASVFRSVNLNVDTIFVGERIDLSGYNLLLVPYCFIDSLQQADYDAITQFVRQGGHLITDTRNYLAEELGVAFSGAHVKVSKIRDRYFPEERIAWTYSELADKFDAESSDEVFCVDDGTEAPLVIGRLCGKGGMIFFSTRFDPYSQQGYSFYPYLLEYVRKYFKLGPVVRRENLGMYFDPGFRHTISTEQLVKQWVSQGIRVIHAAGWHQYPKYTYDYKRLIELAHANGILVYAWLEPPQVSQKFWLEHPEWREKNFKGEDSPPAWRYLVALTDEKCLESMAQQYTAFLQQFDWDGVDLAELYFESARGLKEPAMFTPMHPSAIKEVRRNYHVELAKIFDPASPFYWRNNPQVKDAVVEYRVRKLTEAYEKLLSAFSGIAHSKEGFQTIVTALDGIGSPDLREQIGVDMASILRLQKKYGFVLQVEDAERLWSTNPMRYIEIGRSYAELVGDRNNVILDLNILGFRKANVITPFPTLIQTGTESFHLVRAASLGAPRQTIYAESSVNPQDLIFFPYALASEVRYRNIPTGYDVSSPYSFVLRLPKGISEVRVDDILLSPVRENQFVIPSGTHTVSFSPNASSNLSAHQLQPRIMSITGNLLSVVYEMRNVIFDYESDVRTLVAFNRQPTAISVDGRSHQFTAAKGNDCFSVVLPPGRHHVEVVTGDPFSYGVNITSFWSTTVIAVFGALAVTSLFGMYLVLVVVRRRSAYEKE